MISFGPKNVQEAVSRLDAKGPLNALYHSSKSRSGHFEDHAAFNEICHFRDRLEFQFPGSRCPQTVLSRRIASVEDFAQVLFKGFDFVEGVVFLGSSLRGKLDPRDHDLAILTKPYDEDLKLLNKYPAEIFKETDIGKLETFLHLQYPALGGVRTELNVEFAKNRWGSFLPIIEAGPYFAIVRSGKYNLKYFCNTSAVTYAEHRKP